MSSRKVLRGGQTPRADRCRGGGVTGEISLVSTVSTVAYLGLEARGVEVQCQLVPGLPNFIVVGLPDKAVAESRERVQSVMVVE